jgi:hypothetical protein
VVEIFSLICAFNAASAVSTLNRTAVKK